MEAPVFRNEKLLKVKGRSCPHITSLVRERGLAGKLARLRSLTAPKLALLTRRSVSKGFLLTSIPKT